MLLAQQAQLVKQQQEALQMALLAKQQAEQAANSAAEQALQKAEAMKKRITPPAKPGLTVFYNSPLHSNFDASPSSVCTHPVLFNPDDVPQESK